MLVKIQKCNETEKKPLTSAVESRSANWRMGHDRLFPSSQSGSIYSPGDPERIPTESPGEWKKIDSYYDLVH